MILLFEALGMGFSSKPSFKILSKRVKKKRIPEANWEA